MSVDEDSFIVIEETPSMLQFSLLDQSSTNNASITENNSLFETCSFQQQQLDKEIDNTTNNVKSIDSNYASKSTNSSEKLFSFSPTKQPKSNNSAHTSPNITLAQSFLLGNINCDTMKSCFPTTGSLSHKDDVEKWRTLIQERNDLKDALQRTNATMQQQYSMVSDWQNSVKDLKFNHESELKKFRTINDELFLQNHDLQSKVAELQHLAEQSRKSRSNEKDEQIMAEKLKNQQLEQQVHALKSELANTIALNVESDEAFRENVQKCDKLQVELVAIQELYKNASIEIAALKAQNECLRRDLEKTKTLVTECREKTNVIQTQCDVYRNDFELERKQREEMACEREQLLADVRMLKKRNQALVDEAQSYYNEASISSLTSTVPNTSFASSTEDNNEAQYVCPICSQSYEILNELESHVQSCLERNG